MSDCPHCATLEAEVRQLRAAKGLPSRRPLSERQREVYEFLSAFHQVRRVMPTFEEIASHFQFRSLATVHEHLLTLQEKGWIRREQGMQRGIILVESP